MSQDLPPLPPLPDVDSIMDVAPSIPSTGAHLRRGAVVTVTPLTVTIGKGLLAVPARCVASYRPRSGDAVSLLAQDGDLLVLGRAIATLSSAAAGAPDAPETVFYGSNNVGLTFGTAAVQVPLTATLDPFSLFNGTTNLFTLPWTGRYRFSHFLVVAAVTGVSYGGGGGRGVAGASGWTSFTQPPRTGSNATMTMAATSPPFVLTAGGTVGLAVFASAAGQTLAGGFGRNNELAIEWIGR